MTQHSAGREQGLAARVEICTPAALAGWLSWLSGRHSLSLGRCMGYANILSLQVRQEYSHEIEIPMQSQRCLVEQGELACSAVFVARKVQSVFSSLMGLCQQFALAYNSFKTRGIPMK